VCERDTILPSAAVRCTSLLCLIHLLHGNACCIVVSLLTCIYVTFTSGLRRHVEPGATVHVALDTGRFGNTCPFCTVSINGTARVTPGITWAVSIGDGASDAFPALNITVTP